MPLPTDELWRLLGLAGADVDDVGGRREARPMAPMFSLGRLSIRERQWMPPSVDFQRPPVAKPT